MLVRVIPKNLVRSDIAIVWSCLTILHRASIFFHSVCSRWQFSAICRQAPGFKHYLCYWNLHLSIKYHFASLVASILGDLSEVTKATAVIKTTWARVCTSFRVCSNLFFIFSRLSDRRFPVFEAFFHDIRRLRDLQEFVSTRLSKTQVQVRRVWWPCQLRWCLCNHAWSY